MNPTPDPAVPDSHQPPSPASRAPSPPDGQPGATEKTAPMTVSDSAVSPRPSASPSGHTTEVDAAGRDAAHDSAFDTVTINSWKDVEPWLTRCDESEGIGRLGGFLLQSLLGRGGMGVVFLALDESLNRPVAIKVLAPSLLGDAVARDRFRREAQSAAAVRHPGIVTIFQVVDDGQLPYIVMEYIDGQSLSQLLADGPLPLHQVSRLSTQIASALSAAHQKGLIHRDIKPANILLEAESGEARITDFGLVRGTDDVTLTGTGALIGTPAYMAPEVIAEDDMDARMDLFSLGATLYHMVVGHVPFEGRSALATLHRISSGQFTPVREARPDCPGDLAALIEKLLSAQPADRYPTSAAVVTALQGCSWTGRRANDGEQSTASALAAPAAEQSAEQSADRSADRSRMDPRPQVAAADRGIAPALVPPGRRMPVRVGVGLVLASLLMAAAWYVWSGRNSYVCRDEDGQQVGTAATLEAAIAATPDGGIVEISGFGDVTVTETILLEKSIELVGVGNHPVRLLAGEALDGPLFLVGAPCNFTNLNIENRHGEGSSDVVSVMEICCGGVVLRHCTLMHEGGTTVLIEDADTVEFIDCHLSNIDGIALSWFPDDEDGTLMISDCKLVARTALHLEDAFSGSCEIVDSRILADEAIHWLWEEEPDPDRSAGRLVVESSTVIATQAVLTCRWESIASPESAAMWLQGEISDNAMAAPAVLRLITADDFNEWRTLSEPESLHRLRSHNNRLTAMDAVEESVGRSTADAISDINTEPELSDRMFDFVVRDR